MSLGYPFVWMVVAFVLIWVVQLADVGFAGGAGGREVQLANVGFLCLHLFRITV